MSINVSGKCEIKIRPNIATVIFEVRRTAELRSSAVNEVHELPQAKA